MTKSKKWLEIAEAYLTPYEYRTNKQKDITFYGLCEACKKVYLGRFEYKKYGDNYSMLNYSDYYFAPYRKLFDTIHDEWRGMFALLMSEAVKTEKDW